MEPGATPPTIDVAVAPAGALSTFVSSVVQSFTRRARRVAISAAVGFAVGWLGNVYVMARRYDGYRVPGGSAASGEGNVLLGSMFWLVFAIVASTVVNLWVDLGNERFWAGITGLPTTVKGLWNANPERRGAHWLWGACIALAIAIPIDTAVSGASGLLLAFFLLSPLRSLLLRAVLEVWTRIRAKVAEDAADPSPAALAIGCLGAICAMFFSYLAKDDVARFVFAVAAGGVAYQIGKQPKPPTTAALLAIVAGLGLALALSLSAPAAADDGGYQECGGSWSQWLNDCAGSDRVRQLATTGAILSAVGSLVGPGVAEAATSQGGGGGGGGAGGSGSGGGGGGGGDGSSPKEGTGAKENGGPSPAEIEAIIAALAADGAKEGGKQSGGLSSADAEALLAAISEAGGKEGAGKSDGGGLSSADAQALIAALAASDAKDGGGAKQGGGQVSPADVEAMLSALSEAEGGKAGGATAKMEAMSTADAKELSQLIEVVNAVAVKGGGK